MKRLALVSALIMTALILYLCFWPVPIQPVSYQVSPASGYTGKHASNNRLAGLNIISLGDEKGPEHVAIGPDGKLYVAVASGSILRMNPDGAQREVFVNTGGRVLGFAFDKAGRLIAADAYRGLLAIDQKRRVVTLVDRCGGEPIRYANSVVIAKNGNIYFSDSSARFTPTALGGTFIASIFDALEQSATGRVLAYNPATNTTRIIVRGLSFANGLALSSDEQSLFVVETGRYRVWKVATAANNLDVSKGSALAQVLLNNLPGFPDNLMRGLDGKIWLGFAKPRSALIDKMANKPFLRKVVLRLPRAIWPVPKPYGHVLAFTERGNIVADLQDPTGAYPETTGVTETNSRLYVQSLHAHNLGWLPR